MTPEDRKIIESLISSVTDPAMQERYREQLAMADDLEGDGLLTGRLPVVPVLRGDPETHSRTYVFQWFRKDESQACDQLVVHTAGTMRALALFEQNAASGALIHDEHISPRCEILSLDADDCRTCFGAGKLTRQGKQRLPCEDCNGTGKTKEQQWAR
jgi:hypothetical protein